MQKNLRACGESERKEEREKERVRERSDNFIIIFIIGFGLGFGFGFGFGFGRAERSIHAFATVSLFLIITTKSMHEWPINSAVQVLPFLPPFYLPSPPSTLPYLYFTPSPFLSWPHFFFSWQSPTKPKPYPIFSFLFFSKYDCIIDCF